MEHIENPISSLIKNVKNLQLRAKRRISHIYNYIGYSNFINMGHVKGSNISFDSNIEVLNKHKILYTLISRKLKTKILLQVLL